MISYQLLRDVLKRIDLDGLADAAKEVTFTYDNG